MTIAHDRSKAERRLIRKEFMAGYAEMIAQLEQMKGEITGNSETKAEEDSSSS